MAAHPLRIVPAIDLKGGQCVRLLRGEWNAETVYSNDPVAMAWHWVRAGAEVLHVVDLDAAVRGAEVNLPIIERLCRELPVVVEVGGGIRSLERARQFLELGAGRVVFGTAALREPDTVREACALWPGRVVVGIDARGGRVAVEGWTEQSDVDAVQLAQTVERWGAARIVYTDIARDGTLAGLNVEATCALARQVRVNVTASGGVGSVADIRNLRQAAPPNLDEVIVGRALYSGALDFAAAVRAARE
jgi:phosphoribosylformimino-5-aminoimidazole carboxamide ribotide isomerase